MTGQLNKPNGMDVDDLETLLDKLEFKLADSGLDSHEAWYCPVCDIVLESTKCPTHKSRGVISYTEAKLRFEKDLEKAKKMSGSTARAEELLKQPDLIFRICKELDKILPNQYAEKKLMLLCLASAKCLNRHERLHVFINAESSSGKSYFMKRFSELLPRNKKESYTKISPQYLAYAHPKDKEPEWDWDGMHLFIEDVTEDLLNSSTFKVYLSDGAISGTVNKGKARKIEINGRPTVVLTSANVSPKNEQLQRFIFCNIDESPEQTRAIFRAHAKGEKTDPEFYELFGSLASYTVKIPYLDRIAEKFPNPSVEARRDYFRFLSLIQASTIIHQLQRAHDENHDLLANEDDFYHALDMFRFTNPENFEVKLTHAQKKAYKDLLEIQRLEVPNLPISSQTALSDVNGQSRETFATTCKCGGAHLSISCICNHFPKRHERKWRMMLERLAEKGVIEMRTVLNPKTKREITIYNILYMGNMGTFDIFERLKNESAQNQN